MSNKDAFDYDKAKVIADNLNSVFTDYSNEISEVENLINTSFNVGDESAIDSNKGADFLKKWQNSSANFSKLKETFTNLYDDICGVSKNTQVTEEQIKEIYLK